MAVRTDAVTDYLYTSTGAPTTADHTVAFWFRINTDRNATGSILMVANATATEYWQLYVTTDGTLLRTNQTGATQDVQQLTAGTWYHLCGVRSGTSNLTYINGALIATQGPTAGADFIPGNVYLGSDTASYVDGDFYAFKTFNAALTAAQVAQEVNVVRPVNVDSLQQWCPMIAGGSGEWGKDYSGNGLTLSVAGTLANADSPPVSWGAPVWIVPPWVATGGGTLSVIVGPGIQDRYGVRVV